MNPLPINQPGFRYEFRLADEACSGKAIVGMTEKACQELRADEYRPVEMGPNCPRPQMGQLGVWE